ncbi:hypothetical protein [Spiroplasma taiwanense]|uniref:hypothetical protein n=1 Tax=Spiroplasma taiwanense TaxID=2145 RepID=UPI0004175350|nr:hypothetical protein [Spiroplasma taiwanense]
MGIGGLTEVSGFFLIGSLIVAIINWQGEENFVKDMLEGAKDIVGVGFIISIAGAITILLKETYIQSLMLNARPTQNGSSSMNPFLFILMTFFIFLPLSFALPSTSGFSYAVFPVWGPLANTVVTSTGVSMVSGSITAFAFANGMANMISPASGIVVGAAQIGRTSYANIMKGTWKFHISLLAINIILLLVGTSMNYINNIKFF